MYIANHYVPVNGVTFTPGEYITEEMTPGMIDRLLNLGAIREAAEAPITEAVTAEVEFTEDSAGGDESAESGGDSTDNGGEDVDGNEASEDEADEEYEEAEPMEIDVADSITDAEGPAPQEEKKPARRRRGGKESNA